MTKRADKTCAIWTRYIGFVNLFIYCEENID